MTPAILFDIDGTLLYAKGLGRPAFAAAFAEAYGVTVDFSNISFVGATDTAIIRDLARAHGVVSTPAREAHFAILLTEKLDEKLRAPRAMQIYPGVEAFLRGLVASGNRLGIVTGNLYTTAWSKLIHARLAEWFSFDGTASDADDRDEIARVACRRAAALGAQPRLLIGDTPKDVQAAHAVGLPCLAVTTGWVDAETLRLAGAEAVISDFSDTEAVLALVETFCHE